MLIGTPLPFPRGRQLLKLKKNRRYPDAEVIGTDLSPIQPGWYADTRPHNRG